MLFLYLYQTYIIQYWTSKRWYVWNIIQSIESHYISTQVGSKNWSYTIFCILNFSITHGNRQLKYQTLISCNKNAVYRGITQTLLLEAFSDLADGLKGVRCLTALSIIFQLYRGSQFYWWRKLQYPEKTIDLPQLTDKLQRF